MGIGDWLGDKVNQVGEAVEDAAETATAKLGEAVDDVLDVGADAAHGLGWDSLGESLDDLGDQVSSALGGEVEERELGETEDPKELIRGEPSAITEAGTSLGKLSTAADQTGEGLRAVGNVNDWEGLGADGFQVGFSPQPGKWTEAADAFTDAKTALDAWSAAVFAAQGLAADAIAQWNAAVQERRRVLARWNSLSDEEKARTTVVDTWSPMFQAARDTLARARTNRDTAAATTVTALSAAKALAPEEPPFISRMGADLEDLGQIGEYAKLSFIDGLSTAGSGLVQFVRQLNPTDVYNLTHPGEYLENLSNMAGGLVTTAADPGPAVDAMIDDAKGNPFEALGALTFDAVTAIPTGGAGLATKPVSLLNRVDNLAPSPHAPTRTPDLGRTAPDRSGSPVDHHADTSSGVPQRDTPDMADQSPRDVDAPPQDRGAGAAPEPARPDANVQAAHQDQPAPAREQPSGRKHTDDDGGGQVEVSDGRGQPSPDSPTARPDTTVDTPGPRAGEPSAGSGLDDPATPGTRPDSDPPGPERDTYTPPTHLDQTPDAPAQHPDDSTGPARADDPATPGTRPDSDSPATRPAGDAPAPARADTNITPDGTGPVHTDPGTNSPGHQPDSEPGSPATTRSDAPDTEPGGHTPAEGTGRADTTGSAPERAVEPSSRADEPTAGPVSSTAPSAPVRDAPGSVTRPDPVAGPARADSPSGRGPSSPASVSPAHHGPGTSNPAPGARPAPDTPAGPRPHPGDATTPRTNLDAGNPPRPHSDAPDTPRRDPEPGAHTEPEHGSSPDSDSPHSRDPDTRGDHDDAGDRPHDPKNHEPSPEPDNQGGQPDSDSPQDPSDPNRDVADAAGDPANTQTARDVAECGDPVDAATGEFLLPETDLTLPGVLPLVLRRRHRSNYRWGRWFGPTWSSTLDMRVVVDAEQVTFLGEDGLLLAYPHADPGAAVPPLTGGVRYTCVRADTGTYRVADPEREIIWHFAPEPGLDGMFGVYLLAAITDRHRNRIRFHYDADGAPAAITHSGGYRVEITTDPGIGRVTALTVLDSSRTSSGSGGFDDAEGAGQFGSDHPERVVVRRFGYAAGNLAAVTNGAGATTGYTYDDRDRMLSWTDSRGTSMVNTYDSAGRVILQHGTDGILNAGFDYLAYPDGSGHLTRHINSQGAVTTRGFDHDLRVRDIMDPAGGHTRIDYNAARKPLRVTAPDNAVTHYAYTADGDVTRIVRPDGLAIDIDYAWRNRPETITHPDGSTEHRDWDAHGNLTATTDLGGIRTAYTYHPGGAVATITEPNTARTAITVDTAGLPITVVDPLGATTHIVRDGFGRPIAVTDPLGHTTRYLWSAEGKLLRRLDPDGHHESWTYDGEGNLLTHTNRAGGTTEYTYGSWDLPVSRTDPDGSTTRYSYDTECRLTAVSNPLGHTWHYRYDSAGRLASETDYNGATSQYTYDLVGRTTAVVRPTGIIHRHTHDILGHLTEICTDLGDWIRYEHDPAGRLLSALNGQGETITHKLEFTYTDSGQQSSQQLDDQAPMRSEFDQLGRRTRRITPSGAETRWFYDFASRPSGMIADGHDISFTHDLSGRLSRWQIDELAIENAHDSVGRLLRQDVIANPVRLLNLGLDTSSSSGPRKLRTDEYAWRPDGHITHHATHHADGRPLKRDYHLDSLGRVTTVTHNGASTERFDYDPLSNIVRSQSPALSGTATAIAELHSEPLELVDDGRREYRNNLLIRDGRTRYHYDESGRLIRKTTTRLSRKPDVWHYRYNSFDQLTDVWTPDHQWWHYTYDALGRRVTRQRLAADGAVLERCDYCWDGTSLVEQTTSDATTRWHYQPGTHTPLAQTDQAAIDRQFYAIVTDFVGTPVELIDPATARSTAAAFTTLWGSTNWCGEAATPLRFPGQILDAETGLHHSLYRTYDPDTGRFLTQDPLGLAPAPNPNTYPNNPTRWIDPLGLTPCDPYRMERVSGDEVGSLFHYTNERGHEGILDSGELNPSTKEHNPNDARFGDGQYLSDIQPGTKTAGQLSHAFLRVPWAGHKYTHFLEIDVRGLDVWRSIERPDVYLIPNQAALDLSGRILRHGKN
ncbi:putative T7SS-secreted protein [Nocardia sp. NPDC127526]|uniref:putative T7SS-secreted protein n=1 Tax=Nocardia sp. NPDC127526 TaxID=3345393 RepID=UPI0036422B8A